MTCPSNKTPQHRPIDAYKTERQREARACAVLRAEVVSETRLCSQRGGVWVGARRRCGSRRRVLEPSDRRCWSRRRVLKPLDRRCWSRRHESHAGLASVAVAEASPKWDWRLRAPHRRLGASQTCLHPSQRRVPNGIGVCSRRRDESHAGLASVSTASTAWSLQDTSAAAAGPSPKWDWPLRPQQWRL